MTRYRSRLLITLPLLLTTAWSSAQEPQAKQSVAKKEQVQQAQAQEAQPPKKEAPKTEAPKKVAPKKVSSRKETPKKETPPKEAAKKVVGKKAVPAKKAAAQVKEPKKKTPAKAPAKQETAAKVAQVPEKEVAQKPMAAQGTPPKAAAKETPKKVQVTKVPSPQKPAAKGATPKGAPAKVAQEEPKKEPAASSATAKAAPQKATPQKETQKVKPSLPTNWVNALQWRSIGPANMSGRIPALAVYEKNPNIWWAASASGGLLKTVNNGVTFEFQFDHEATVSVGDVQVAQSDPNIVWVGTGEANPRNSVSWGDGVYKSVDGGKTWKNMGLKKTFQIGRVVIHPKDTNIVYVGALGRLWGPNEDRGLYKTVDGGKTWKKILYIDDKTGIIDVKMNPKNPEVLIAATYERQRDGFDGNDPAKKLGPGSGVYLTKNGGKTFQKVTKGLPNCNLGRIGISIYRKDPRQVYLVLESEKIGQMPEKSGYAGIRGEDADIGARLVEVTPKGPAEKAGLQKGDILFQLNGKTLHSYSELVRELDARQVGDKLKLTVSRDRKDIQVELVLGERPKPKQPSQQRGRPVTPMDQARAGSKYAASLGGQRENMVQGPDAHQYGGIYHSSDGGVSWKRINSLNPRPMYYSQIRVDPSDNKNIWVLGTSLYLSKDGGATFSSENTARGIHVDHHSMWIDPRDGNHVILGNDGGMHVTFDQGLHWDHLNHVAIGQFYHVAVGPRRNYRVFGGLQDNGSWGAPHRGADGRGAINTDWVSIGGGDGFVCAVDPEDPDQIYSESQGGATGRYNLLTGVRSSMRPRAPRGTRFRFNWKTPFLLSPHNSRIYYSAGNYVFRSPYKGNNLQPISPEITLTDQGSASALAESPREVGVLYVGTTDGALWASRNAGHDWTNLYGKEKSEQEEKQAEPEKKESASARDQEGQPSRQSGRSGHGGPPQMARMLQQQDANGDGKIQRGEMPERMARMFDRLDANGDDALSKEELEAFSQRFGRPGGRPPTSDDAAPEMANQPRSAQPAEQSTGQPDEQNTKPPLVEKDIVSGTWEGKIEYENIPANRSSLTLVLRMDPQGKIKGTYKSAMADGDGEGKFNPENNELSLSIETERSTLELSGTVAGTNMSGQIEVNSSAFTAPYTLKRTGDAPAASAQSDRPATPTGKPLDELIPGPRWISSIEASRFKEGRVYITCDGHRSNDDLPYLFVSEDYGTSWTSLLANLPNSIGSTRVIREDVQNQNVLYLGTEFSIWVSIDRGQSWTKLNSNLPTVAVHEIAIHPTAGEIVAGTHGRSLWVLNVAALRQLSVESVAAEVSLYRPLSAIKWRSTPRRGSAGTRQFRGETPPSGASIYYSLAKDAQAVTLKVSDIEGRVLRELEGDPKAGLHRVGWDLQQMRPSSGPGRPRTRRGGSVSAGKYLVTLTVDSKEFKTVLTVEDDPDAP